MHFNLCFSYFTLFMLIKIILFINQRFSCIVLYASHKPGMQLDSLYSFFYISVKFPWQHNYLQYKSLSCRENLFAFHFLRTKGASIWLCILLRKFRVISINYVCMFWKTPPFYYFTLQSFHATKQKKYLGLIIFSTFCDAINLQTLYGVSMKVKNSLRLKFYGSLTSCTERVSVISSNKNIIIRFSCH